MGCVVRRKLEHRLTEASRSQEDPSDSVSVALRGNPDDDAARHDAEHGGSHPEPMVLPNTDGVHSAGGGPATCPSHTHTHRDSRYDMRCCRPSLPLAASLTSARASALPHSHSHSLRHRNTFPGGASISVPRSS